MISGIHHVKLPVSDVRHSRDWYEHVLGFDPVIEFNEQGQLMGQALRQHGCQLALRQDPDRAAALSGFDALALLVPSRDEIHAWKAVLDRIGEAHGGVVTGHDGGSVLVGLRDPDGIEIRLYAD